MSNRSSGRVLIVAISVVLVAGSVSAYHSLDGTNPPESPPETECTQNPDREACLGPNFADDNDQYLYDLDVSWVFSGRSEPTDQGPSIFIGQAAGSLQNGLNPDSGGSGASVNEYFIQNTGKAGTDSFAQGSLESENIEIPSARTVEEENGDRLANPPHQKDCGDGQTQSGETTTNCPQDLGTPKVVELTDQPQPERTNQYNEPSGSRTFQAQDQDETWVVPGTRQDSPDHYETGSTHIEKEEINGPHQVQMMSGTHEEATVGSIGEGTVSKNPEKCSGEVDKCSGSDCGTPETFYTGLEKIEFYDSKNETEKSDTEQVTTYGYDAPDRASQTLTVTVEYSRVELSDPYYEETNEETFDTQCTECEKLDSQNCDCNIEEKTVYSCSYETTSGYQKNTYNWKVNYESFSLSDSTIWGPVDDKPGMFSVDVVNTNYGYHSDISDLENNKQGSNDPSVSANKYELIGGNTYFEAHRTSSNVADADGPDGTGDGTIAFKQGTGVTGTDENIFTSETWNGNDADYTGKSDVQLSSCPGDSIRCIASLDLKTQQTGWGDNPGDSYEIVTD